MNKIEQDSSKITNWGVEEFYTRHALSLYIFYLCIDRVRSQFNFFAAFWVNFRQLLISNPQNSHKIYSIFYSFSLSNSLLSVNFFNAIFSLSLEKFSIISSSPLKTSPKILSLISPQKTQLKPLNPQPNQTNNCPNMQFSQKLINPKNKNNQNLIIVKSNILIS